MSVVDLHGSPAQRSSRRTHFSGVIDTATTVSLFALGVFGAFALVSHRLGGPLALLIMLGCDVVLGAAYFVVAIIWPNVYDESATGVHVYNLPLAFIAALLVNAVVSIWMPDSPPERDESAEA